MKNIRKRIVLSLGIIVTLLFTLIVNSNSGLQAAETNRSLYNDISNADPELSYVQYLSGKEIIKGYPDGSFKPQEGLTRAQAAVVIVKAAQLSLEQSAVSPFKDLPADHWGRPYIAAAVKSGYISGYPDGTFKPEQKLSRAEGISLILKLSEQPLNAKLPVLNDINNQHWAAPAVATGLASGMVGLSPDGQNYLPNAAFTRINMVHALGILLTRDPVLSASSLPGKIKIIQGSAQIIKAGSQTEAAVTAETTVTVGDSIITGSGSSAELNYPDGSSLLIKENSQVIIKAAQGRKYIKSNGQEGIAVDWLNLDMQKGTMFTALATKHESTEIGTAPNNTTSMKNKTKTIASLNGREYIADAAQGSNQNMPWYETSKTKKVKVKVDMPWGVAAVRGTFVVISIAPNGQASVSCLNGDAEVSNGGQTVSLGQNQSTQVNGAAAPPPTPAPMPPEAVQLFTQVVDWIQQTAQLMDQNQEQPVPAPPAAMINALQEILAPSQPTTPAPAVTPATSNAMTALQAINQALGNIGITVGNDGLALKLSNQNVTPPHTPGGHHNPADVTAPTMTKLTAIVDNETIESTDGTLNLVQGSVTTAIKVIMSEPVSLVGSPIVMMNIAGVNYEYGTIALDPEDITNKTLIITPNGSNGTAGLLGQFAFTVAANSVKDAADNKNAETAFNLTVAAPPPIASTNIVQYPAVGGEYECNPKYQINKLVIKTAATEKDGTLVFALADGVLSTNDTTFSIDVDKATDTVSTIAAKVCFAFTGLQLTDYSVETVADSVYFNRTGFNYADSGYYDGVRNFRIFVNDDPVPSSCTDLYNQNDNPEIITIYAVGYDNVETEWIGPEVGYVVGDLTARDGSNPLVIILNGEGSPRSADARVEDGDKLKVTSEDGSNIAEYTVDLQGQP